MDVGRIVEEHLNQLIPKLTEQITKEVTSRLNLSSPKPESPAAQAVHEFVRCDGCSKKPIVGIRYKCAVCHDFDFCEECEAKDNHPHPFLKIRRPELAPKSIMVAIEDNEQPGLDLNGVHYSESQLLANLFGEVKESQPTEGTPEPANVAPVVSAKEQEDAILENAAHLESLFEVELIEAIQYARNNKGLDREQIAEKWIIEHF